MKIGAPLKLFDRKTSGEGVTRLSTRDDSASLELYGSATRPLADLFKRLSAETPGRKIAYKALKPDVFFVVTGEEAGPQILPAFAQAPTGEGTLRGFAFAYPLPRALAFDPIALAIANSFEPFPAICGRLACSRADPRAKRPRADRNGAVGRARAGADGVARDRLPRADHRGQAGVVPERGHQRPCLARRRVRRRRDCASRRRRRRRPDRTQPRAQRGGQGSATGDQRANRRIAPGGGRLARGHGAGRAGIRPPRRARGDHRAYGGPFPALRGVTLAEPSRADSDGSGGLRGWATKHLGGVVLEKVLDLCQKRDRWSIAYRRPNGHRTSNMLDRLMRGMNRYFEHGQHLHGSRAACRLHCRAWALLWNFAPWHPATMRENDDWRCPAERLNRHRYHEDWLQNLLISASLAGYRSPPPQNP